jgi:predicted DNA-binding protein
MEQRTNRLQVLLSDEERQRLNKVANEHGMKPSVYARAEIIKAVKRDE